LAMFLMERSNSRRDARAGKGHNVDIFLPMRNILRYLRVRASYRMTMALS
jgi:hypothetical protein